MRAFPACHTMPQRRSAKGLTTSLGNIPARHCWERHLPPDTPTSCARRCDRHLYTGISGSATGTRCHCRSLSSECVPFSRSQEAFAGSSTTSNTVATIAGGSTVKGLPKQLGKAWEAVQWSAWEQFGNNVKTVGMCHLHKGKETRLTDQSSWNSSPAFPAHLHWYWSCSIIS